ncbi:hypothetical protein FRC08_012688 [Ceratobasidium sp. 394]|nr:hypothetical protein FRC08_012688 [Ceratobasidium sp. 394]
MSTLWEVPKANEDDVNKRRQLKMYIRAMLGQLEPWIAASNNTANDVEMDTDREVDDATNARMDDIEALGQPDN